MTEPTLCPCCGQPIPPLDGTIPHLVKVTAISLLLGVPLTSRPGGERGLDSYPAEQIEEMWTALQVREGVRRYTRTLSHDSGATI